MICYLLLRNWPELKIWFYFYFMSVCARAHKPVHVCVVVFVPSEDDRGRSSVPMGAFDAPNMRAWN